jgi:bacillithiol synthase
VSAVTLGEGIRAALERTREILPPSDFCGEVLDGLAKAYGPEASYSLAFGSWMGAVLKGRGVVFADPSDPRIKRLLAPLFLREIREASPVSRAVLRRTALLEKAGYRAQVETHGGFLTLFLHGPGRESIAMVGDAFLVKALDRRYGTRELLDLAEESPERFSPNAVFRPLCQDGIFPTVATVLGPSEIAYHFQLSEAYADLGIPQPILFPRASMTLVEPHAASLLRRTGATLADVLSWRGKTAENLAARRIPAGISDNLERGLAEEASRWAALRDAVGRLDPTLLRTTDMAAARVGRQYRYLRDKVVKSIRRREAVLSDQAARITAFLCPDSSLQERVYPLLPYLAAYGPEVLDRIEEAIDTADPSHVGVEV